MDISTRGKIELCCKEGVSLMPYLDSQGVITIAVGATVSEIPDLPSWPRNKSITINYAFDLFEKSLAKYVKTVNDSLKVKITQPQFDALVSFCYNVGQAGEAHSSVIKLINSKADGKAIYAAFMLWTKNKELIGRRTKEALLYETGIYRENGVAQLYETDGQGHIKRPVRKTINLFDYIKDGATTPAPVPVVAVDTGSKKGVAVKPQPVDLSSLKDLGQGLWDCACEQINKIYAQIS